MKNKSGFYHEGIVIRRRGYDPGIDIELIDVEFAENLGKICAQYGLNPNRPPLYSLNDDNDGAENWNKRKLLCTVAAKHAAEQYSEGHLTVFDLFHHYYSLRGAVFCGNEEFLGRPSLDEFEGAAEAIAHRAVLQGFFLHHRFQRYSCDANFDFDDWTDYAKKQILQQQDLFAIAQFLVYTESRFFDDHDAFMKACEECVKSLSPIQTVKTYSSESNGFPLDEVVVPRTSEYERIVRDIKRPKQASTNPYAILFPSLFDESQAEEIYQKNPCEKLNILSQYPTRFNVEEERAKIRDEIIERYPKFENYKNAIDVLLAKGVYSFHIQTRLLG